MKTKQQVESKIEYFQLLLDSDDSSPEEKKLDKYRLRFSCEVARDTLKWVLLEKEELDLTITR